MMAEIAAYAGQWDADSRNVSRQLGAIARTWADDLQKELQSMDAATPEEQKSLHHNAPNVVSFQCTP